jgi:hypothetical protein
MRANMAWTPLSAQICCKPINQNACENQTSYLIMLCNKIAQKMEKNCVLHFAVLVHGLGV